MIFLSAKSGDHNNGGSRALMWLCTERRIRDPIVDHNLVLSIRNLVAQRKVTVGVRHIDDGRAAACREPLAGDTSGLPFPRCSFDKTPRMRCEHGWNSGNPRS